MSNNMIMIWVGLVSFAIMLIFKIPIKKWTWDISDRKGRNKEEHRIAFRRYNLILMVFTAVISFVLYCLILLYFGDSHIKLCCSLKGAGIAIALYAVVEQITGNDFSKSE